ncbi:MAG: protein kinase [candidate division Zixibacteria bacterium]|nr:protein kinase [candidate division Zixibacteria bacterium]
MTESVQEKKKQVKIGDYVLTGKIGQGGIAEIYKGRQASLNRDVAIKILTSKLTTDPEIVRRFERESMVIAKLNHPNIVHVIDKGKAGNRYYFVMEYVDGTSLREVIERENIPIATKLEMIVQVLKALDYAHKNGVIHRDIKPTNILIDRQGNPRVADFGIAQIVGTPEGEMTSSDVIMGTLAYMSPEQKVSSTNVDQTTDLYAIGIILYEILTGKKPLGRFKMPTELNPKINAAFDDIIMKCLAQEPAERYQTAVDLKNDILNVLNNQNTTGKTDDYSLNGSESFIGKCRYLDTIKETKFSSTILVENKVNKKLYIIKKHNKGEAGRKEAKLLSSLKHKNINNIFGSGGDNKSTVIISQYAPGGSLAERMVRKYDWQKAIGIILQVASGLDFAHKNNVIHGNLRPSNILFDAEEVVKLTDFGMPIHYDAQNKKNWYSPPERKQSRQGDIYGMGVIFHQLLTGRTPRYDAGDNLWLDDVRMEFPEEIYDMLTKLLAIRVPFRYKSCEEFLLDWEDYEHRRYKHKSRTEQPVSEDNAGQGKIPVWAYILFGLGLIAVIFTVLYFTGTFR